MLVDFLSIAVDSDSLQSGKSVSEPWNILRYTSPEVAFQVQKSGASPGSFSPGFRIWMGGLMGDLQKMLIPPGKSKTTTMIFELNLE